MAQMHTITWLQEATENHQYGMSNKKTRLKKANLIAFLLIIVTYLQPAAHVVLPWTEERIDGLFEAGVEHIESLHCNSIVETKAPVVIVQIHADARRVPVVGEGNAAIFHVGI